MSKNNFIDFKELKQRITIEQILDHYNLLPKLTRKNDQLVGSCPICKTGKDVFKAHTTKNVWNCFAGKDCSSGNILDLVMQMEGADKVREAAELIVEWFDTSGSKTEPKVVTAKKVVEPKTLPTSQLTKNLPLGFSLKNLEKNHSEIHNLGLKPETVAHFGLGWCSKGMLKGRIAVPICNMENELVAYAGLPSKREGYKFPAPEKYNPKLELYNAHNAFVAAQEKQADLIIVQDCLEVWHAYEHGLNAVALLGQSLTLQQLDLLLEHLPDWHPIILVCEPNSQIGDMLVALTSNFSVRYVSLGYGDKHVYNLVQNMQEKTN